MKDTVKAGPIIHVGDYFINLMEVVVVTDLYGDVNWRRYRVHLTGGHSLEIYDSRMYADGRKKLPQMKQVDFIKAWFNYKDQE